MSSLSVIQKYFACAVNDRGKIPKLQTEKNICLIVAGLAELQSANCIEISEKEVRKTGALPPEKNYLKPIYDIIDAGGSIPVREDLSSYGKDYDYALLDQKLSELIESVGHSLESQGIAKRGKTGLFGGAAGFVMDQRAVREILEKLDHDMDGEEDSLESLTTAILLERGKCLSNHLTPRQQEEWHQKLKKIMQRQKYLVLQEQKNHLDHVIASVMKMIDSF